MIKLKAPKNKFRVICVDFVHHDDWVVGDYSKLNKAIKIVDERNFVRKSAMADVYYVYDDKGQMIHGDAYASVRWGEDHRKRRNYTCIDLAK